MSRLTNKDCNKYEDFVFSLRNTLITSSEINDAIYKKLKSLEDLEEELKIDLGVLFSALKIGVWYFDNQGQLIHDYVWLINNYITAGASEKLSCSFETFYDRQILSFEDYGKTWSLDKKDLTKKELENEEKI